VKCYGIHIRAVIVKIQIYTNKCIIFLFDIFILVNIFCLFGLTEFCGIHILNLIFKIQEYIILYTNRGTLVHLLMCAGIVSEICLMRSKNIQ
jgi:hypothetical protein